MGIFLLSLLFPLSCLGQWVGVARTFTVVNSCPADIWVGISGSPTPGGAPGWRQASGATKKITVPGNSTAARIWGQTGCSWDASGNPINCKTGTNGAENTLFEWTFGQWNNLDWTDISLVDGWNMGMLVTTDVKGASGYNCGPIDCTAFTPSNCPPELTLKNSDGSFQFCQNACNAMTNSALLAQFPYLSQQKSALQTCCTGGCTPTSGWPTASNGVTYYNVLKNKCKTSYAWSGDDSTSMFSCSQFANYTITFSCPGSSSTPAPAPAPAPAPTPSPSPTPSPTPSPAPACTQYANTDAGGGDFKNAPTADATSCCALCKTTGGCTAWSYYLGVCYMKNVTNALTSKSGVTSGTMSASAPAPAPAPGTCAQWSGYDYYGGDMSNSPASSAAGCCTTCQTLNGCQAWSYAGGVCYFKNAVNSRVASSGVITGLKTSSFLESTNSVYHRKDHQKDRNVLAPSH